MTDIDAVVGILASEDLERSGLTQSDVAGLELVGQEQLRVLPETGEAEAVYDPDDEDDTPVDFEAAGGYTIPYYSLDGKPVMDGGKPFSRIRLLGRKNDDVPRYRSPKWSKNHVYVPQGLLSLLRLKEEQNAVLSEVKSSETLMLYITEGEKKAICAVKAGIPTIALPGIQMWADSAKVRMLKKRFAESGGDPQKLRLTEDTPVNPELLDVIAQIKALCPELGVVCILFDSDGKPIPQKEAFKKVKGELVPVGGVDWKLCTAAGPDLFSANPQVTAAGYKLSAALRKQSPVRCAVVTRFCVWNQSDEDHWVKQGLDDWLKAASEDGVKGMLEAFIQTAAALWGVIKDEPLFHGGADPDELGKKGTPHVEIAFARLLDPQIVGKADDMLYEWVSSHWQVVSKDRSEEAAHRLVNAFYADTERNVLKKIKDAPDSSVRYSGIYKIPPQRTKHGIDDAIIPCRDVTLDVSGDGTIQAREPSKEDGLRYCIDVNWADRHKPCPLFMKFLESVLPDEGVRGLVQQYIGYTLMGDTRHEVAQWWFGSGSNGKSVLAKIVSALHRKVAGASLGDMTGFNAENLVDASLITVDETPKRIDEQNLKMAISGGQMRIGRKWKDALTVELTGKWLLRGNDKPSLTDQTDGLWRRLHVIHFEQRFGEDEKDPLLAEKILNNEMPGVFMWAMQGLVKILKAGKFVDIPEKVFLWKQEMQIETNSVMGWWEDKGIQITDTPRSYKEDVYSAYSGWCKENGLMPLGSPNFWTRVNTLFEREGQELITVRVKEKMTDPLSGGTTIARPRRVNIDLDGHDADAEQSENVVPIPPRPRTVPEKKEAEAPLSGFAELGEDDILF